jgi:hypothetical protein
MMSIRSLGQLYDVHNEIKISSKHWLGAYLLITTIFVFRIKSLKFERVRNAAGQISYRFILLVYEIFSCAQISQLPIMKYIFVAERGTIYHINTSWQLAAKIDLPFLDVCGL